LEIHPVAGSDLLYRSSISPVTGLCIEAKLLDWSAVLALSPGLAFLLDG